MKIGRYNNDPEEYPESVTPRSELTLDNEEFSNLINFLSENYELFKKGVGKYVPIEDGFDVNQIERLQAIFKNPDKQKVLDFIQENDILPDDLIAGLQFKARINAVNEFEKMLDDGLGEADWQNWFEENDWVLGSEFVEVLEEREIDSSNISDYLMKAYDGFLDVIEIKKPSNELWFWAVSLDHGNYVPSTELVKAITQSSKYIYEVEREADSIKFLEKVGNVRTIKPRCVLIFGRSINWDDDQKEAYRILNSSYHNLSIMTYDHVLNRAKRILGIAKDKSIEKEVEEIEPDDIPFKI